MASVAAWLLSVVTDGTRVTVPSGPCSGLTLGGSLRPHLPEPPPAQVGEEAGVSGKPHMLHRLCRTGAYNNSDHLARI